MINYIRCMAFYVYASDTHDKTREQAMKLSIDTLPLWDAFRQHELCPFCQLEDKLEETFLDAFLGESVMEPDTRVEVNTKGFCREHYRMLYRQKTSKLGLALMTHTHLKETMLAVEKAMGNSAEAAAAEAEKRAKSCAVCERTAAHMARYYETALHLWQHDADFKALFDGCGGFCLPHWGAQLKASRGSLFPKGQTAFVDSLISMEKKSLSELEKDLEGFTRKFDYRNADKPWGNSKDALPRAINTLEGYIIKSSDS
jgi:hypothetical protein